MSENSPLNFYEYEIPDTGESFDALLKHPSVRILRIVSSETPDPVEYDQEEDEWVLLLEGSAVLELEGKRVELRKGEHLFLPARTPHRVLETERGTLWIAVHIGEFFSTT
jgi:cupin 2 domain-containing protein